MKRLGLLVFCAACASAEQPAPSAGSSVTKDVACPQERISAAGDVASVLGKRVEKACVLGGSQDLGNLVAPLEGQPLEAKRVSRLLEDLFKTGVIRDAEAVATPVDGERVVLAVFVTPYDTIAKVRVVGAEAVGAEAFVQLTPERFAYASPFVLRVLGDAVREIYRERGYPRAQATVAMEQGEAVVTVSEGTRDDIKRIRFSGAKKVKEARLREVVRVLEGSVYVADVPAREVMHLESFYHDNGMVQVQVAASYQDGDLVFTVNEGDVFKLGALKLTGMALPDGPALLGALGSKRGAVYSRAVLIRDIERIREYANSKGTPVNVTPLTTIDAKKKTIDVTLELSPAS